jgi:hypothetical protein
MTVVVTEAEATFLLFSVMELPTKPSTIPYRVTEDWAIAAPEAARTAKATSDFFISNISKVKTSDPETSAIQNPEPTSLIRKLDVLKQTTATNSTGKTLNRRKHGAFVAVMQQNDTDHPADHPADHPTSRATIHI